MLLNLVANFFFVLYTFFIDICKRKYRQKQVKKKAFKINAKIEDVGLNEDLKSTETRNGHSIFMINQNLKILHTASFFLSRSFLSLLGLYQLSLPQKKTTRVICVLIT